MTDDGRQKTALGKERPPTADLPPACRAYGPEGGAVLRTFRGKERQ